MIAPLTARQEAELEQFDAVSEQMGVARKGDRGRLEARHKREARRVRVDELRGGMATMMGCYRDDVAAGGDPGPFRAAAEAVQVMADSLRFNPNEGACPAGPVAEAARQGLTPTRAVSGAGMRSGAGASWSDRQGSAVCSSFARGARPSSSVGRAIHS